MIIAWGSKSVTKGLGKSPHYCETCNQERDFTTVLTYQVSHFCYAIRWATGKSYRMYCDTCRRVELLKAAVVEASLKKSPVPFIDRFGWAVSFALLGALFTFAFVADAADNRRDVERLASPQVGDIYVVDLAAITEHPQATFMYSALKVTQVNADEVEVSLPQRYATKISMIRDDVGNGTAKAADYYTDKHIVLTRADLRKLQMAGNLYDVDR